MYQNRIMIRTFVKLDTTQIECSTIILSLPYTGSIELGMSQVSLPQYLESSEICNTIIQVNKCKP